MTQRWLPQRDDQYYGQKLHLRVCKRSVNHPSSATAAVGMHSRCLIYRKIIQYFCRIFSLPSTCMFVTIEGFCLQVQKNKRRSFCSLYTTKLPTFFVIFSNNRLVIDVALSFRSTAKLRYQSQKKRSFYERTFVRRSDLSAEIRHDKLRVGNR